MNARVKAFLGLLVGGFLGLAVGGFIAGLLGALLVSRERRSAREGWPLRPVLVAARDLSDGPVSKDDLMVRSVPEVVVTRSLVNPDGVSYLVNQHLEVPVRAGEPLWWGYFETSRVQFVDQPIAEACEAAAGANVVRFSTPAELRAAVLGGAR